MKKIIVVVIGFLSVLSVGSCASKKDKTLTSAEAYDILYTDFFQESRDSYYADIVIMPANTNRDYVKKMKIFGCYGNVEYVLDASYQYQVNKVTGIAKLKNQLINGYVGSDDGAYSLSSASDTFNVVENKDFIQNLTSKKQMDELCCSLFRVDKVEDIKKEYDTQFEFLSGEIRDGNTIIHAGDYEFTFTGEDNNTCTLNHNEETYQFSFDSFAIFNLPDKFTMTIYELIK